MFYKRISDLHPLGEATDGNWQVIKPIRIPNPGKIKKIETGEGGLDNIDTRSDDLRNKPVPSDLPFTEMTAAFNGPGGQVWYDTVPADYNYITARVGGDEDEDSPGMKSEYYAKSLWFEVGITKKENGQPTSKRDEIKKYQSKRLNAYLLFTNIDEISVQEISAQIISANTIFSKELSSTTITTDVLSTDILSADYGDIKSLSATSITANAISSNLGIINNISGDNLYYNKGYFTDITVTGKANLIAEAAYWADVAEIYTADKGYLYGTLVKFGGEKEITIADDKANAVISEKPAITLNSGNKEENALPIVLTGRSKVRTIHPVKKFDKIYLSETPGVGSVSSYKISSATMPIGIALESKPYDEEGLIECILQLNFE